MDTRTIVVLSSSLTVVMALIAVLMRLLLHRGLDSDSTTSRSSAGDASGSSPSRSGAFKLSQSGANKFGQSGANKLSQSGANQLSQSGANKLSQSGALKRAPTATEPTPDGTATERFVRLSGHSSSSHHPRELDLSREADEIHLHVHQHGESHTKVWVTRPALQEALEEWAQSAGGLERLVVPGRTARKELPVTFVFRDTGEVEVQADWWVRVGTQELKTALERLGVRVPW
jgi:hypothetical protein